MHVHLVPKERFSYQVRLAVYFDVGDLRVLRQYAEGHYDRKCRCFFEPGPEGTGNAWRHFGFAVDPFGEEVPDNVVSGPIFVTWRDLDRCCKILEGAVGDSVAAELRSSLDLAMKTLAEECDRRG